MNKKDPFMNYLETGQIEITDGHIKLFNVDMSMMPASTYANLHKKVCDLGEKGRNTFYEVGKDQIKSVFSAFDQGYNVKIMDVETFMKLFAPSLNVAGWRKISFKNFDYDGKGETTITIKNNPYAKIYKEKFGLQKQGVDDYSRGLFAAGMVAVTGKKLSLCSETKCIAKGDDCCEFKIKLT